MFSLVYVWINGWINCRKAGDLRRYGTYYEVIVMENEMVDKTIAMFSSLFCELGC